MKNLSTTLLSLTVLVVIFFSTSCGPKEVIPPTPTPDTQAPTVPSGLAGTATTTSVSLSWNPSTDNVGVSGYKIYRGGVQIATSAATSYTDNGLASSTAYSYTVSAYDAAGNNSTQSAAFTITTSAPALTAVFTATVVASAVSLPGNSVAEAFIINVTTAGTAKLETIGTMTNGSNAVAYYWITSRDSSELFQATSTLNAVVPKTVATTSQNINLAVGKYVVCFKTAVYSGAITNGSQVGLKLTGAALSVSSINMVDAVSANLAGTIKIVFYLNNNTVILPNGQTTGGVTNYFRAYPYSDQSASVYDGALYPSISAISFDTKNTSWFTGNFTGYSNLDFTNAAGSAGQNFVLNSDNNGTQTFIFSNSDANFTSGALQFSKAIGIKLTKSGLGNFAYCSTFANVYNPTSSTVGPFSVCWYLKSIRFVGNPELWIYDPSGNRIW